MQHFKLATPVGWVKRSETQQKRGFWLWVSFLSSYPGETTLALASRPDCLTNAVAPQPTPQHSGLKKLV